MGSKGIRFQTPDIVRQILRFVTELQREAKFFPVVSLIGA
jgi:hypothetical protein